MFSLKLVVSKSNVVPGYEKENKLVLLFELFITTD